MMPQFKIRCINAATGDLYEIEREGAHYEQARLRAVKDGHEIAPSKPFSTVASAVNEPDPAVLGRIFEQMLTANKHLKEIEKTTSLIRFIIVFILILWLLGVIVAVIAALNSLGR